MKRVTALVFFVCFFIGTVAWAQVETGGTPKDAQQMLKKAVAYVKEAGKEKAIQEFGDPKGKFIYKDVYISVYDLKGNVVNHPYIKALVGKNCKGMMDADGKPFANEIIEKANSSGSGTVEYKWTHPNTKKMQPKIAYFEKVGDIILSGSVYK